MVTFGVLFELSQTGWQRVMNIWMTQLYRFVLTGNPGVMKTQAVVELCQDQFKFGSANLIQTS